MAAVLVFSVLALAACAAGAFVAVPILRRGRDASRRWLTALLLGLGVTAGGGALYLALGHPGLAVRMARGPDADDFGALIGTLAREIRHRPDDVQGWVLLGRGYRALGETAQATRAYARAVTLAKRQDGAATPQLLTDYAEAMAASAGAVTPEAETLLREALALDPKQLEARYLLGLAHAVRGERDAAMALWNGLAAEAPPDAPWRETLIDQMAALTAETGETPDIAAMVQGLAARLETNPNDLDGWLRLIRAYAVLGDTEKAQTALTRARATFAADASAQEALNGAATENALN